MGYSLRHAKYWWYCLVGLFFTIYQLLRWHSVVKPVLLHAINLYMKTKKIDGLIVFNISSIISENVHCMLSLRLYYTLVWPWLKFIWPSPTLELRQTEEQYFSHIWHTYIMYARRRYNYYILNVLKNVCVIYVWSLLC